MPLPANTSLGHYRVLSRIGAGGRGERRGARNLWLQPFDGGAPKQLTDFKQNGIYRREWTRDGKQLAIVRGQSMYEVVMITDLR